MFWRTPGFFFFIFQAIFLSACGKGENGSPMFVGMVFILVQNNFAPVHTIYTFHRKTIYTFHRWAEFGRRRGVHNFFWKSSPIFCFFLWGARRGL